MNKIFRCTIICALMLVSAASQGQRLAVKGNLLYGLAGGGTPNFGVEVGLGQRTTLDLWGAYNPWDLPVKEYYELGDGTNRKLVHWIAQPEIRYWPCERFSRHFFGLHALYSQYNISEYNLPLIFGSNSKNYRFEGNAIGGGISYGYHWVLANRLSMEFTAGVGYVRLTYDKYDCVNCKYKLGEYGRDYFGPTKAAATLIFMIR